MFSMCETSGQVQEGLTFVDDHEEELERLTSLQHQNIILQSRLGETSTDVYDCEGATHTVIMCHGCGGCKDQFREGLMPQKIATRFKVIAFDW